MTRPRNSIQKYSIRINKRKGRDDSLENLPDVVENTLIGILAECEISCKRYASAAFGDDMMGYGHDELKPELTIDLSESKQEIKQR